ncbi:MAG: orotidine-5'-phosphate decarboxylase [Acidobacteriota bacterium]|nr:orotidine-5'-phosphate decarboxylase [Acidobacteriota bacterium]
MTNRILAALDVPDARTALAMVDRLRGAVGGFKVGKQLFTAEGPALVRELAARGDRVFLDLKFHDIPNTVAGAIESACGLGVWMVNVHASGGRAMMSAARDAADRAAEKSGTRTLVIAVTVLTSLDAEALRETGAGDDPPRQVERLALLARDAGLDGVVCSPQEIELVRKACGPAFAIVTPGIRGASDAKGDQQRTATPAGALKAGADYLVIGRPITAAADPRAAAEAIGRDMTSADGARPTA